MKRALIFGVGGMDGSHLAELLLERGYEVHGTHRRSSYDNLARLPQAARERITLHRCELTDVGSVHTALYESQPDEVYNMADQDEVGWSKDSPGYSVAVTYGGPAAVLEFVRQQAKHLKPGQQTRFFQPISSTVFRNAAGPCNEESPLAPASPYACAKAAAWLLCKHYRREHGVFVSCGVFFNHTSPRQKESYLLPTIARQAVEVALKRRDRIELNGPDNWVDVGWAPDYVAAAWGALQQDTPTDRIVATGAANRISRLCKVALREALEVGPLYEASDRFVFRDQSQPNAGSTAQNPDGPRTDAAEVVRRLVNHYAEALR